MTDMVSSPCLMRVSVNSVASAGDLMRISSPSVS